MKELPPEIIEVQTRSWEIREKFRRPVPPPDSMVALYRPMRLRRRRVGKFVIKTEKATTFDVVNQRQAWMLGIRPAKMTFEKETVFHRLVADDRGGCVTSDLPIEVYTQYISFSHMRGRVLVGGLGLGMCINMMFQFPSVKTVTVVEREPDIITLVKNAIDPRTKIVQADLFDYLKTVEPGHFDSAYFDIWGMCNESTFKGYIVPLFRLARKAGINNIGAWGEYEMEGELASSLYARARMPDSYTSKWKPHRVFLDGLKRIMGPGQPYGIEREDEIIDAVKFYIREIGTPEWERYFHWPEGDEGDRED